MAALCVRYFFVAANYKPNQINYLYFTMHWSAMLKCFFLSLPESNSGHPQRNTDGYILDYLVLPHHRCYHWYSMNYIWHLSPHKKWLDIKCIKIITTINRCIQMVTNKRYETVMLSSKSCSAAVSFVFEVEWACVFAYAYLFMYACVRGLFASFQDPA